MSQTTATITVDISKDRELSLLVNVRTGYNTHEPFSVLQLLLFFNFSYQNFVLMTLSIMSM